MTAKQVWCVTALAALGSLMVVGAVVLPPSRASKSADPPPAPVPAPPAPAPAAPIAIAAQKAKLKLSDGRTATFVFSDSGNALSCAAAIGLDEVLGYGLAPIADPPPPSPAPAPAPVPDPVPSPAPQPAPAASSLRVLFTYDPLRMTALPAAQQAILSSPALRSYLDKHCPLESGCLAGFCPCNRQRQPGTESDQAGRTPSYRFLPGSADVARLAPVWRQTMQSAAGKTEPWMIAVDEAGQTVIDQAWPATVDDCLRLLRRYGGQ